MPVPTSVWIGASERLSGPRRPGRRGGPISARTRADAARPEPEGEAGGSPRPAGRRAGCYGLRARWGVHHDAYGRPVSKFHGMEPSHPRLVIFAHRDRQW